MKIAIAGGSGFVGRHVVEALHARGHAVLVLARGPPRRAPAAPSSSPATSRGDRSPRARWPAATRSSTWPGSSAKTGPQTFEAVHVDATRRLLAACARGRGPALRPRERRVQPARPAPPVPRHEVARGGGGARERPGLHHPQARRDLRPGRRHGHAPRPYDPLRGAVSRGRAQAIRSCSRSTSATWRRRWRPRWTGRGRSAAPTTSSAPSAGRSRRSCARSPTGVGLRAAHRAHAASSFSAWPCASWTRSRRGRSPRPPSSRCSSTASTAIRSRPAATSASCRGR